MAASDARGFAGRLAASDDDALARLFDVRGVSPTASWADFFDAAEALLEPPALLRGLAALTRAEADAVAAALATGTAIPDLISHALNELLAATEADAQMTGRRFYRRTTTSSGQPAGGQQLTPAAS